MSIQKWFLVIPPAGGARAVALEVSNAFTQRLGPENVKSFDCLQYQKAFFNLLKNPGEAIVMDLLNQSLVISCIDFCATHCLTGALSPVTSFSLVILKKTGIITLHWFYEDFRRADYWKYIIGQYDYFCAIQRGQLVDICNKAGTQYVFLPTAHSRTVEQLLQNDRPLDIGFIGIPSTYRIEILEKLAQAGFKMEIAGSGWNNYQGILRSMIVCNSWTNQDQAQAILNRSKIGINLSVENPENRDDIHISPRVFDILAARCILLSEDVPLLHEQLKGYRYKCFNSPERLCSDINNILKDYSSEFTFSEHNRSLILENDMYVNRVDRLVELTCAEQLKVPHKIQTDS
jgi:hypothetical protein